MDGSIYKVGGVRESFHRAYLNRTDLKSQLKPDPDSFQYRSYRSGPVVARYPYTAGRRGAPKGLVWPPRGVHLQLVFTAPKKVHRSEHKGYYLFRNEKTQIISLCTTAFSPPHLRHFGHGSLRVVRGDPAPRQMAEHREQLGQSQVQRGQGRVRRRGRAQRQPPVVATRLQLDGGLGK